MKNKFTFALLALIPFFAYTITSCLPDSKQVVVDTGTDPQPPPPAKTCDGLPLGSTRSEVCQDGFQGQKLYVCKEAGWNLETDSCTKIPGECSNKVNWTRDIKPLIEKSCLSCHTSPERYDDYEVAKRLASEMIRRINLPSADLQAMPKPPVGELTAEEKELFNKWRESGYIKDEECPPTDPYGNQWLHLDLDYIESKMLEDQNRLDGNGRRNARYLIMAHKYDLKSTLADLQMFEKGINKAVNSISHDGDLTKLTPIDPRRSIYRIDLRAFDLNPSDWETILSKDVFKFESFTNKGTVLKDLSGTKFPWLHADNFTFAANDPDVYYSVLKIPNNIGQFFSDIGLDFQKAFDNFEVLLMGFNGSPISLNKNRALARFEIDDGYAWQTFDPIDIGGVPERNLFQFPLLAATGGKAIFDFAASEIIWSLPNGLQGWVLFNAAGERQNAAPLNVVTDVESPFDPEIKNSIDCFRCHSAGLIPSQDQIREHVLNNAGQFDREDVELVKAYYRGANTVSATFQEDNARHRAALDALEIKVSDPDPVNYLTDRMRKDYNLKEVASFLFMTEDEFKAELRASATASSQIGQLASGGTISFFQLIETFPTLVKDFRLGQDPIDD